MATTNGVPNARFGIKEVADVKLYEIVTASTTGAVLGEGGVYHSSQPTLVFNTLKVSNIESTAEQSEARGGKGNAPLIIWDYGREITVTLEDALLSMETLALMFENSVSGSDNKIVIDANTFPGTYYLEGTTYARDENTGKDDVFTFIIPKAKMQSEVTLTMEAEGDPTVFSMTMRVLRCTDGTMMVMNKNALGTQYTVTFKFKDGKVTTIPVTNSTTTWASIKPENTSGYKWNPAYPSSGNVDKNANYEEVSAS